MAGMLPGYTWIDNPRSGGGTYETGGPSSILLHMTVSTGLSASYVRRHPYPPHLWANPYTGDKWQTVPLDRAAFALYQPSYGNCWTNKKGYTLQTELVGVPVVNQETYTDDQLRWIAANVVVPQAEWLASIGKPVDLTQVKYFTDSSGSATDTWWGRMSEAEWDSFNGLHQHISATYNDHWDCSVERLDLIAQYAREILGETEEDIVASIQDLVTVLRSEGISGAGDAGTMLARGYNNAMWIAAREVLRSEGSNGASDPRFGANKQILDQLAAMSTAIAELSARVDKLAAKVP